MADCRACIYFIPKEELSNSLRDTCEKVNGSGFCRRRNKIVRYFSGKCRYYRHKYKQKNLEGKIVW